MKSADALPIAEIQASVHRTAVEKGWWDGVHLPLRADVERERLIAEEKLLLVTTEIAEAMEEIRAGRAFPEVYHSASGKPEGFGVELADAVIRIFDLAESTGVPLAALIWEKAAFNATRPHRHGGKVA